MNQIDFQHFFKKNYWPIKYTLVLIFVILNIILVTLYFTNTNQDSHKSPHSSVLSNIKKSYKDNSLLNSIRHKEYYVDCLGGLDSNSGTSKDNAWKSIEKVNSLSLKPGEAVLLKRGCEWAESLSLSSSGTESENIIVDAYGKGGTPIIKNNAGDSIISVKGSHVTIQNVSVEVIPTRFEQGCADNPLGSIAGISLEDESSYVTIKNSRITGAYAGVFIKEKSIKNVIESNEFINNNMMYPLDHELDNDAGAFGILIWGDDNIITKNLISGSNACSYDYTTDGGGIEIYGGKRNLMIYNTGRDNDAFTELGNPRSSDNTYAYNLFSSSLERSIFLVTRGESNFGPVYNTQAINNTVYLTGKSSQGFACISCTSNVLSLVNNIIWADGFIGRADGVVREENNLFWGKGRMLFRISATSKYADPLFRIPGKDFTLLDSSPAILSGIKTDFYYDLNGKRLPEKRNPTIGAYEL